MQTYNNLASLVKTDRAKNGKAFNIQLKNHIENELGKDKSNAKRNQDAKNDWVDPTDDLDLLDLGGSDTDDNECEQSDEEEDNEEEERTDANACDNNNDEADDDLSMMGQENTKRNEVSCDLQDSDDDDD